MSEVNTRIAHMEQAAAYTFRDRQLLQTALTHSSYANEKKNRIEDNQRLEFLGDSVLSISVSTYLYQEFPGLPEGSLTKIRAAIVSEPPLAEIARTLGLGACLLLGRGEEATGGRERPSVLADAMEAVIGAIYLDSGLESARDFVWRAFAPIMEKAAAGKGLKDYKTELQELLQKDAPVDLTYRILSESGPDHDKVFDAEVLKNDLPLGRGRGRSKKEAEQQAARDALASLGAR